MPMFRVLTWNPGGEAGNRGQELTDEVGRIDNNPPGGAVVQVVAVQEATLGGGGISGAMQQPPVFQPFFIPRPVTSEEFTPGQRNRGGGVGKTKAYLQTWRRLLALPPPHSPPPPPPPPNPLLFELDPLQDVGLNTWITTNVTTNIQSINVLVNDARRMRYPLYTLFRFGGRDVHFFTWHVDHARNFLSSETLIDQWMAQPGQQMPVPPNFGVASKYAFLLFQNSTGFRNIINQLNQQNQHNAGVIIIAGDLNCSVTGMLANWMFGQFQGRCEGKTHILAYSPSAGLRVDFEEAMDTPYRPHAILSAAVTW